MLVISRKEDQSLLLGDYIEISVVEIKGNQVKIAVKAPNEVKILRAELDTSGTRPGVVFKSAS